MNKNTLRKYKKIIPLCIKSKEDISSFSNLHFSQIEKFYNKDDCISLNEIGFRGKSPLTTEDIDVAAFGCSFTFGVGVKQSDTFLYQYAESNSLEQYINFGMPGESIRHIADLYTSCVKLWNIKKTIILLPSIYRNKLYGITKDSYHIPCLPQDKNQAKIEKKFYKFFRDEEFIQIAVESIERIILANKSCNISCVFASYAKDNQDLLDLLDIDYRVFKVVDKGSDGAHPGPKSHKRFSNVIQDCL